MADPRTWPCPECNGAGSVTVKLCDLTHAQYLVLGGQVQGRLWCRGEALVPCETCKGTGKYRTRKRVVVESKNPTERG